MERREALIQRAGDELYEAWISKKAIPPFTQSGKDFTQEEAYRIQRRMVERLSAAGYHVSGKKMGYTDPELQRKMGLSGPSYGCLLREQRLVSGSQAAYSGFIQPGIEAEILFVIKEDMTQGNYDREGVIRCVNHIRAALEIVDMRQIRTGKTQLDSIGDNGAFGAYVVGEKQISLDGLDLAGLTVKVFQGRELVKEGVGSRVMGDPIASLLWAANRLARTKDALTAGSEFLSGSFISLTPVFPGDELRAEFETVGEVCVHFV